MSLRPLRADDFADLYAVAADPLIWAQHPANNRHEELVFGEFFGESLASGGALLVTDARDLRVIGSSRFHGYDEHASEVEIGWTFLARSHWGGRYNGEVKQLMLRHALRFVASVVFFVSPGNARSHRAQASEACEVLRGYGFDTVVSSTLLRASETASIIASALGLRRLDPMRHFDERFAGPMSGMASAEIEARWPGFLEQWKTGTPVEIPGGEPWQAFVARVLEGVERLRTVPGTILVVSHMGVQRAIEHGFGRPLRWYGNLEGLWVTGEPQSVGAAAQRPVGRRSGP